VRMTAEEALAAQLESRLGSLSLASRHRIVLEQDVFDGIRWTAGPHPVGWIERPTPDGLRIRLFSTEAGRTAAALLEEELVDVVLSHDHPPKIRLTAGADPGDRSV